MPNEPSELPSSASGSERDRVIRELGDHFAHDHLSLDEYEQRLELALRALQRSELQSLTRDLPALVVPGAAPVHESRVGEGTVARVATKAAKSKTLFALMSGIVRRGRWTVAPKIRAVAIMGGIEIDLREAEFTAPVTEIFVFALMGGAVVRVPPHVRLECDGIAIMGGFEDQLHQPSSNALDAPLVRVRGVAIMGGVETKVVERGVVVDGEA
jgi:hypothetical protein